MTPYLADSKWLKFNKVELTIEPNKKFYALAYILPYEKDDFQIQVYDFLAHGNFSDYNGLLGPHFFEGKKFCADMELNAITLTTTWQRKARPLTKSDASVFRYFFSKAFNQINKPNSLIEFGVSVGMNLKAIIQNHNYTRQIPG